MKPKYYRTRKGAEGHAAKVAAVWANLETRIAESIGHDFRTRFCVEVRHPSQTHGAWLPCGAFSRKTMRVDASGRVLGPNG